MRDDLEDIARTVVVTVWLGASLIVGGLAMVALALWVWLT